MKAKVGSREIEAEHMPTTVIMTCALTLPQSATTQGSIILVPTAHLCECN
jgi:hypothetical protein